MPIKTDGVCLGWGLTRAVRSALADLAPDEAVDRIYCDQNGETYRADECGFMLARLASASATPPTSSPRPTAGATSAPRPCRS